MRRSIHCFSFPNFPSPRFPKFGATNYRELCLLCLLLVCKAFDTLLRDYFRHCKIHRIYMGSPRIISRVISRDALFDSGAFDRSTWQTTNRKLGKINEVPFSRRIKCTDVMRNRWGEEIMRGWKSVVILGGDNGAVVSVVQHDKMKIAGKNDYL